MDITGPDLRKCWTTLDEWYPNGAYLSSPREVVLTNSTDISHLVKSRAEVKHTLHVPVNILKVFSENKEGPWKVKVQPQWGQVLYLWSYLSISPSQPPLRTTENPKRVLPCSDSQIW